MITHDFKLASGKVCRMTVAPADPGSWQVAWGKPDAEGNFACNYVRAGNAPVPARGVRLVYVDNNWSVPYFQHLDGTWFNGFTGVAIPDPTGSQPPVIPPPPPAPDPAPVPLPPPVPTTAQTFNVVVVPMRYQPPPNVPGGFAYAAYMTSLPKVTQAALQALFSPLAAWWSKETYGKQQLNINVLPALNINTSASSCDFYGITAAGIAAAKGTSADRLIFVTTYACWQSHMETSGAMTVSWGTTQDSLPEMAHELGHQFGLYHAARHILPEGYVEYGNGADLMSGPRSDLNHIMAAHKIKLGVLKPMGAGSYTLRSIHDYPDAVNVGQLIVEYSGETLDVQVSRNEYVSSSYGGSDTTLVARLAAGQKYSEGAYTVTHTGGGKVVVG